jgi:hypothetical protein
VRLQLSTATERGLADERSSTVIATAHAPRRGARNSVPSRASSSATLVALVAYLTPAHDTFGTVSLEGREPGPVLGLAALPRVFLGLAKSVRRRRRR